MFRDQFDLVSPMHWSHGVFPFCRIVLTIIRRISSFWDNVRTRVQFIFTEIILKKIELELSNRQQLRSTALDFSPSDWPIDFLMSCIFITSLSAVLTVWFLATIGTVMYFWHTYLFSGIDPLSMVGVHSYNFTSLSL